MIRLKRYKNPKNSTNLKRNKLCYITSSIREFKKYINGEERAYSIEETLKRINMRRIS